MLSACHVSAHVGHLASGLGCSGERDRVYSCSVMLGIVDGCG